MDRLGRLKRGTFPGQGRFENGVKDWVIAECLSGRVLCDTYISSKELLREVRNQGTKERGAGGGRTERTTIFRRVRNILTPIPSHPIPSHPTSLVHRPLTA